MGYFYTILIIIVNIGCCYFIINDLKKLNIPNDRWKPSPGLGLMFGPFGIFIYLMSKWETNNFTKLSEEEKIDLEKKENQRLFEKQKQAKIYDELKLRIPSVCPNCKNPNSKKLEICEWCGSNVI